MIFVLIALAAGSAVGFMVGGSFADHPHVDTFLDVHGRLMDSERACDEWRQRALRAEAQVRHPYSGTDGS